MEEGTLTMILTIAIMLLFSAFFSGMEIAFLGRNRLREEIDRKQNPLFNRIADTFSRNSSNYITTILVGNNIALVIYSMFMSKLLLAAFGIDNTLVQTIISTVVIIFITFTFLLTSFRLLLGCCYFLYVIPLPTFL